LDRSGLSDYSPEISLQLLSKIRVEIPDGSACLVAKVNVGKMREDQRMH